MNRFLPVTDEIGIYNPNLSVEKAQGNLIWFEDGQEPYFDLMMAYGSTNFGHCNPIIVSAVKKTTERLDNIPAFNTSERDELSSILVDYLPSKNKDYQVYYTVGGAKAVDASIKLARIFTKKNGVICFDGAFHGYISGLIGITDRGYFNESYDVIQNLQIFDLPFPDNNNGHSSDNVLSQLEKLLEEKNSEIGVLVIEPIQGASGFKQTDKRFFEELQKLAKRYQIVIIADEIQMGIGRTGLFYSFERYGFEPDIILLGKSLAGGFYPLSAIIARKEYFDLIGGNKSGLDSTFSNNAFGIAIAREVVRMIADQKILEKSQQSGKKFYDLVKDLQEKHPHLITNTSVIGLACGIQTPSTEKASLIKNKAFENKLIIQTAGTKGDYLKIAPSLLITEYELENAFDLLDFVFKSLE